jgi:DNA polymerase III beta subunit
MEAMILKNDLLEVLKKACLIAPKLASDSIVQNVKLSLHDDKLTVYASDCDQYYQEPIIADIQAEGETLVSGVRLKTIIGKIKDQEIFISLTGDGYLEIKAGKLKTRLPAILEADRFPVRPEIKMPFAFGITPQELKNAFDLTYPFIGENEARRNLMGLNIKENSGKITLTGADAFKIAEWKSTIPAMFDGLNITYPKLCLKNATKIFNGEGVVQVYTEGIAYIRLVSSNADYPVEYQTRLIESDFPNLDRLLQGEGEGLKVKSDSIVDSLEMLKAMGNGQKNAVNKLELSDNTMRFINQKIENSDGETEVDCEYHGEDKAIGLNTHFMIEVCKIFKKQSCLSIRINGPDDPLTFSADGIADFKAILMPVRIQW